jgi:hypothetical protein
MGYPDGVTPNQRAWPGVLEVDNQNLESTAKVIGFLSSQLTRSPDDVRDGDSSL